MDDINLDHHAPMPDEICPQTVMEIIEWYTETETTQTHLRGGTLDCMV